MKRYILIAFILFFYISNAQNEKEYFLLVDSESNELCQVSKKDNGRYHSKTNTSDTYLKTKSSLKEYSYRFYICKELFLSNTKIDTLSINYLKDVKISDITDLKEAVAKTNPLYPFKVFPNLYIVEKIDASTLLKYKVKWKYYVE
ncbi:MAG: hypothetical protein AB8B65_12085 [Kordia sp.]|uniref:hypothetical protein n=1 Tax=Kordia sp. TaxID=1965332 RepID=UPI00385BA94B